MLRNSTTKTEVCVRPEFLNEVLSLNAQEWLACPRCPCCRHFLNEVLSLNAQELAMR